jgi:hypothetical protein
MILFLRRPMTMGRTVGIFLLCIVALLSKEQGLLLPALLLVLEPVRRGLKGDAPAGAGKGQAMLWLIVLLTWSVSAGIVVREEFLHLRFEWDRSFSPLEAQPLIAATGADRWLIPFALAGRYAALMVAPLKLSIDYGLAVTRPTIALNDFYLWIGFAAAAGWVLAVAVCIARRKRVALFCLLATAVSYSMSANFILIGTIFAERLMYLTSVFLLILLAMLLCELRGGACAALVVVLLGLGCLRSFTYARQWNDRQSFYEYSVGEQPKSVKIHWLVGQVALEQGRLDDARQAFEAALKIAPEDAECWQDCGLVEEAAGNWAVAEKEFQKAFDMRPTPLRLQKLQKAHHMAVEQAASRAATESTRP